MLFCVCVCVDHGVHMPLYLDRSWTRVVLRGSKLSSPLLFLVVLATLSRSRSGDKVTITCYLLCD